MQAMMMNKTGLFVVAMLLAQQAAADHYGPQQCVSVERSDPGSCTLKTNCKGVDTSNFEFMFACGNRDGTSTKHSFGVGGFDDVEEYDTEVKCSSCHAPSWGQPEGSTHFAAAVTKREPTKKEINQVAKFGPDNCVSTYPSDTGTCIVKTDCKEKALEGYGMGIVCADNQGEMVRHAFGTQSFTDKETFDTLIPCTQCLAMDNFDSGKDTEEQVLKDEVETLKADFNGLNARVTKLESGGEEKEAPAKEEPKAEEAKAEEPAKAFLAHKRQQTVHKKAVRAATHKKAAKASKKHVEQDDEDDEEDSDDQADDQADDDEQDSHEEEEKDTDTAEDDEQEEDDQVKPDRV